MSINKHSNAKALIISTLNSVEFPTLKDSRKQFILNHCRTKVFIKNDFKDLVVCYSVYYKNKSA